MSDGPRRTKRRAERIDYARLHLYGDRVVLPTIDQQHSIADNQPPLSADLPNTPEFSINEVTFIERIELSSDTEDLQSVSSSESSNESTITPSSDTSLDRTLTADTLNIHSVPSSPLNRFDLDGQLVDVLDEIMESNGLTDPAKDVLAKITLLVEDLNDYIEENPMHDSYVTVEDVDERIKRVENVRTRYRELHKVLKDLVGETEYANQHLDVYEKSLNEVKGYIKDGKSKKAAIRSNNDSFVSRERQAQTMRENEIQVQREATSKFLLEEIKRTISVLDDVFNSDNDIASNDEIQMREGNLSENLLEAERLSEKFRKLLETIPESYPKKAVVVHDLTVSYNALMKQKDIYKSNLLGHVKSRELEKLKSFSSSSIQIDLKKFKGFTSELDVYSFREEFEKLYIKDTPTNKLADLLKHNHLANPALGMVKSLQDYDEIWKRLQEAYGDPKTILSKLLAEVKNMKPVWKLKTGDEIKDGLVNLINGTRDLVKVAKQHGIEAKLYNGEGLDILYDSMGEHRVTRWIGSICEENLADNELWERLLKFLERELKVQQQLALHSRRTEKGERGPPERISGHYTDGIDSGAGVACSLCKEVGHATSKGPDGILLVQYFACRKWVESTCAQRFRALRAKNFCHQCLFPGAKREGKHATGSCQSTFVCPHTTHHRHPCKKHVLVCFEHRENDDNLKLLEEYKKKFILTQRSVEEFSKNIRLSFITCFKASFIPMPAVRLPDDDDFIADDSIYELQVIVIDGERFTLFFDNGCSDMCITSDAIRRLRCRAIQISANKLSLDGVGNIQTAAKGEYLIRLPLASGKNAVLIGACLEKLTCEFPTCRLDGEVEQDIHDEFRLSGGDAKDLPSLCSLVGGAADIMIGSKYMRYFPKSKFICKSGLTIYESPFLSSDGSRGVVCGPHKSFNSVPKPVGWCKTSFYTNEYLQYKAQCQMNELMFLPPKGLNEFDIVDEDRHSTDNDLSDSLSYSSRKLKQFERCESAGSEISFRCTDCRGCPRCRRDSRIEYVSIEEEIQQDLVEKSIRIDVDNQTSSALLPLMNDPVVKLAPNKKCALKVYRKVLKSLEGKDEDLKAILASEQKLQSRGKVDWVSNLSPEIQNSLKNHPIQNFIPWRAVYNENSTSTPCRLVFDASAPTPSGVSLNDIVAKGRNSLNKLVEVVIRWFSYPVALHTDVEMMYNSVLLDKEHWCLQRYIFQRDLDPNSLPEEKIIKTLIYGVKSSGNLAEAALRETARLSKDEYPRVFEVVHNEFYMDDCLSGGATVEESHELASNLETVLLTGGFKLKGFTFSGEPSPEILSNGKEYINVAGYIWYSDEDMILLNIKNLNFVKKQRGRRITTEESFKIPEKLTKRILSGKVAEIFDLVGKVAPIVAHMKIDLRKITVLHLGWDDTIPDEFRSCWLSHFETMRELSKVKFRRAVVPEGAVSLEMNTICFGDASKELACSAVYVRFELKDGTFSCQLVFARTKLLSENNTQPRRELTAAIMCVHTGEVVRRALSKFHKSSIKFTDSQIVLHWICNSEIPLRQYVRDRIIEILRWSSRVQWHYIRSADMIADLGTRPGATIQDIDQNSAWNLGYPWMRLPVTEFPMKTCNEVKLDTSQTKEFNSELVIKKDIIKSDALSNTSYHTCARKVPEEVGKRYKFSKYLLDPNKYDFSKCVRVIAMVMRFVRNFCKKWTKKPVDCSPALTLTEAEFREARKEFVPVFTDAELNDARKYYFRLATLEIKHFVKAEHYTKLSQEHEGILYYTGRILPMQKVTSTCGMTKVMKDLSESSFFVPIVDKNSPLAFSVVREVHWNNQTVKHSGVETTLRYTLLYCYILEGRELVRKFTKACERCRFLRRKTIEVAMGPVSEHQLRIAPSFYVAQVDLAGWFKAYSPHNKRTTIKIYLAVFCCAATGTVSIKTMEDYSTQAFIQCFIRLSCEVGYPKLLLIDEGSQLKKGCETMELNFRDIKNRLYVGSNVQFETCPVSGHYMHGRVERKIRQIRSSLEKNLCHQRLSLLQWETIAAQISNSVNNLPIGLRGKVADLEHADLLTPNRLRLGRNNDRSPEGPMLVTSDVGKFIDENQNIFNAWFETWMISYVPTLMNHPKWFNTDSDISIGDVILFLKEEGHVSGVYQYGMVHEVDVSKDGKIRRVVIKYRNHNENFDRYSNRAVREIVVIHPVDELSIMTELADVATFVNMQIPIDDY